MTSEVVGKGVRKSAALRLCHAGASPLLQANLSPQQTPDQGAGECQWGDSETALVASGELFFLRTQALLAVMLLNRKHLL